MISETDRQLLASFVANQRLFEAVRSLLLAGMVGEDFSRANWVFTIDDKLPDNEFGRQVKTKAEALRWIERGFNDLKRLAADNPQAAKHNEVR